MQRLLLPELLLAWLHIRHVAGQPVVEFHLQLCFERLRIDSRTHSPDQVQEVAVRPFQPRRRSIDQQLRRQRQPEIRHAPPGQLRSVESRRSHADHRERMPVDLIAGANHRRVGAVLLLPDAVAHHRHRRRAFLIVRIGHQPADPRLHAESPEEISGHILPVARIRLRLRPHSADAKRRIAGLQRRQVSELRRVRAKVLVRLPREQRKIPIAPPGYIRPSCSSESYLRSATAPPASSPAATSASPGAPA